MSNKKGSVLIRNLSSDVIEMLNFKYSELGYESRQDYLEAILLDHLYLNNSDLLSKQEEMIRRIVREELSATNVLIEELIKTLKY